MTKTIYIEGQTIGYYDIKQLKGEFKEYNISIDDHVEIGDEVEINRDVSIGKGCVIGDGVVIQQNTTLESEVKLQANVELGMNCYIKTGAVIGENSVIKDGITIGEDNIVPKNTLLNENIHFVGSVATVTYVGNEIVCIGCKHKLISNLTDEFLEDLGKEYHYTPDQIEEYKGYVNQIKDKIKGL